MSITLEKNQQLNLNAILYDEIWAPILKSHTTRPAKSESSATNKPAL